MGNGHLLAANLSCLPTQTFELARLFDKVTGYNKRRREGLYLGKALRKYAIDESDDTKRCSVELNRANAAKTKSPSDDCSNYDIDMAELKLDVAMLTALLHKDQEKLYLSVRQHREVSSSSPIFTARK